MQQIHDILSTRWSPRAFSKRAVETGQLRLLFEAARWAPSCYNDQPWYFIVGQRDQGHAYDRIFDCLVPFNQSWAATAPVLMLSVAREAFAQNDKPNRHAWFDVGQAMGHLLVQATHLGLAAHQMAGFDAELAQLKFAIPAGFSAIAAAALGYVGDPSDLPAGVEEKKPEERERKSVEQFVFTDNWNKPFADR